MKLEAIPIDRLLVRAHSLWADRWLILAAGDLAAGEYNAMTVAWGSLGCMWNFPFAQVVVRPTRHTYGFMERFPGFTLSVLPEPLREAARILGTRSGRDGDKIAAAGLTPVPSERVAAPAFAEAELVLECRTLYSQDMDPARFLDPSIEERYPEKDYHRVYFGEIVAARGTATWNAP
ncbi:MAG: flavin reductase family protein [Candidatus Eisenbacteria bacterium]|nr:flavin reductase family protein [Candidatus Eisenbacteria bacterium]